MGSGDWLGLGHCSSPYRGPAPTLRRGAGTPAFRAVCSQAPGRLHFEPPGQAGPGQGPQHSGARDCAPAPLLLRGGAQRRSMRAGWQGLCQGPRTARLWGGIFPQPHGAPEPHSLKGPGPGATQRLRSSFPLLPLLPSTASAFATRRVQENDQL